MGSPTSSISKQILLAGSQYSLQCAKIYSKSIGYIFTSLLLIGLLHHLLTVKRCGCVGGGPPSGQLLSFNVLWKQLRGKAGHMAGKGQRGGQGCGNA